MQLSATEGMANQRSIWGESNPPAPSAADAWWYAEQDLLEEMRTEILDRLFAVDVEWISVEELQQRFP